MKSLDPRVLGQLESVGDAGWEAIILRLTNYAVFRARRYRWRTPSGTLAEGKVAEDVAMDAISQVWLGERVWDPTAKPNLLDFLKSVVDSRLGHLEASADHRKRQPASGVGMEGDSLPGLADPALNPEEALLASGDLRDAADRVAQIRAAVHGQTDMELVLLGLEEGKRPGQIADDLELTREHVYQLIRKIKRWASSDASRRAQSAEEGR